MTEESRQSLTQRTAVVILAAGQGKRMGRADMAKVCFEIDGEPAINRIIETFKRQRFERFVVVVGSHAEQVLDVVGRAHPEVVFVCQTPQLGTGHAARVAAEALQSLGHDGPVLVTLGDKFLEDAAIKMLVQGYVRQQADLALLTVPRTRATELSSGRVFLDDGGQAVGIIEATDLGRQAIVDELREMVRRRASLKAAEIGVVARKHISNPKKVAVAAGELMALAEKGGKVTKAELLKILDAEKFNLRIDGKALQAQQIEKLCKQFNPSLYLFTAESFYRGVSMIDDDNAQGEYYLTDIVKHLGNSKLTDGKPEFRVRTVPAETADVIQGFNSPDELLAIQDYLRRRKPQRGSGGGGEGIRCRLSRKQYGTVEQWISKVKADRPALRTWLRNIYGRHDDLHAEKTRDLLRVLNCYGRSFGFDQKVVIVRAPGRINLMGRHVDHRGGFSNFLAIDRETIAVAGLRGDGQVVSVNTEPKKFAKVEFGIADLIGRFAWSDWINFVNSDWVRRLLHSSAGDWGNYIKAAMLRLQHQYTDLKVSGMNVALTGNVPMAAGLSSSSTIVVATLQAAIALNNLELTSQQFIDLCGQGEWFVGSRGGAGDHAAIYLGQRGKIAHVGYLPFRVEEVIDAPADYQVVIANSHIKAPKSSAAKDQFNSRITAYNLGLALLRQRCPEIAHTVEHVRDLNPEKLGCRTSELYRHLLKVPESMTRKDFRSVLAKEHEEAMEVNFSTHAEPRGYDVRGVLLFGAAEVMRSRLCIEYLRTGNIDALGELMKISHDGDRVAQATRDNRYGPLRIDCSDEKLNQLSADLASEDPQRVLNAQLYMQPGSYACSTEEIDRMVDIACAVPGVAGAQIAGAGLGGCIMVLVRRDRLAALRGALVKHYYRPAGLTPAVLPCRTVEGAGLAEF